jgi:hypothetical protein
MFSHQCMLPYAHPYVEVPVHLPVVDLAWVDRVQREREGAHVQRVHVKHTGVTPVEAL